MMNQLQKEILRWLDARKQKNFHLTFYTMMFSIKDSHQSRKEINKKLDKLDKQRISLTEKIKF